MTISSLVHDILYANSSVQALIAARVYPLLLPQHPALPALTYQRISNVATLGNTALRESRYQVNCYASTYTGTQALAAAVKGALEECRDTSETPGIKFGVVVNELDDYDPDTDTYRVIVDVILTTTGD